MTISLTIIIICGALILLSVTTPLINILLRLPHAEEEPSDDGQRPALSIIVVASDNAIELRDNLPRLLEQDYPAGYEVIVVVEKNDDETDDILKHLCARYDNLYTTFIPSSSRYMSRRKLAVTVGVKAAKNEWMVLTDATCVPASALWLSHMASHCDEGTDMVTGYSNYGDDTARHKRFMRMHTEMYLMRETMKGTAYRTEGNNLMFRKSMFMKGRGYEGNLKYVMGEYDFLVNKYAERHRTAVEMRPDAWIMDNMPTKRAWMNKRIFYMETRKHLKRRIGHRLPAIADATAMHVNYIAIVAAAIVAIVSGLWVMGGAAALALLITVVLRTVIGGKAVSEYCPGIATWMVVPLELSMVWCNVYYRIRYIMADKYDFICHKV